MEIAKIIESNNEAMRKCIEYVDRLEIENKRLKQKAEADQLYIASLEEENTLLRRLELQPCKN